MNKNKILSRFLLAVAISLASTSPCPAADYTSRIRENERRLTSLLSNGHYSAGSLRIKELRSNINSLKRTQDLVNKKTLKKLNDKIDTLSGKKLGSGDLARREQLWSARLRTSAQNRERVLRRYGMAPMGNRYPSQPQAAISRNMIGAQQMTAQQMMAQLYKDAQQQHEAMRQHYARQKAIMMNQYRR